MVTGRRTRTNRGLPTLCSDPPHEPCANVDGGLALSCSQLGKKETQFKVKQVGLIVLCLKIGHKFRGPV